MILLFPLLCWALSAHDQRNITAKSEERNPFQFSVNQK
ncbi:MAG: hypothetical protein ACI8RD_009790, partial [Bacillariaceae sp.]